MKTTALFLLMFSFQSFAVSEARCYTVDGFYKNSPEALTDLRFETIVDIFTITNARTLRMNIEGENLRFLRENINVNRQTQMVFKQTENNQTVRTLFMMLDRTPNEIAKTKEYYGNMYITPKTKETNNKIKNLRPNNNLAYNFYCRL